MDLLSGYSDDESVSGTEAEAEESIVLVPSCALVTPCAPDVSVALLPTGKKHPNDSLLIGLNARADIMSAPYAGPANPFTGIVNSVDSANGKKSGAGFIEKTFVEDYAFDSSYKAHLRESTVSDGAPLVIGRKKPRLDYKLDEDDDGSGGPWAVEESEPVPVSAVVVPAAKAAQPVDEPGLDSDSVRSGMPPNMFIVEPDLEAEKWERVNERKLGLNLLPPRPARGTFAAEAKTEFHGTEEKDYLGRSWMQCPPGIRPPQHANIHPSASTQLAEHECFIPKKCIHKFQGHTKGVQAIELFPYSGHLLLSAGMDGKCLVWDTTRERNLLRSYLGHTEAVRSINISNNGSTFLSSSYDRYMRLWDTETGAAIATFSNRKMHYQAKFHPTNNNLFLCASSDNRLYGWDCRSGTVTQEYNYHLQPASTVTFFDEGRKFVSTSDDKKILVWEFDIPVPIKYIQEQDLHAIPSVTLHPTGDYFCGQSMDNTIVTYSCADDKVRPMKKKTYRGHNNSGYACQISFSPDGRYLLSGDGQGNMNFWDWKSGKLFRKLHGHDGGPCIGTAWHPLQPSWVFSCGWDGNIKLWD